MGKLFDQIRFNRLLRCYPVTSDSRRTKFVCHFLFEITIIKFC